LTGKRFPHLGLRISYDGAEYLGFQRQARGKTIQAELERALLILLKSKHQFLFTSRTDAGVHAFDQWGILLNSLEAFLKLSDKAKRHFLISMNALLPETIRVWSVFRLREDFHPKTSVTWKEYHYSVVFGPAPDPITKDHSLWICRRLNLPLIKNAMAKIEGKHDFASFATRAKRYQGKTLRHILRARLVVKNHPFLKGTKILSFQVRGAGFLHNMVRGIVGTALEIGAGRGHSMQKILGAKSRIDAGVNAPAYPLCLVQTFVSKDFVKKII